MSLPPEAEIVDDEPDDLPLDERHLRRLRLLIAGGRWWVWQADVDAVTMAVRLLRRQGQRIHRYRAQMERLRQAVEAEKSQNAQVCEKLVKEQHKRRVIAQKVAEVQLELRRTKLGGGGKVEQE